MILDVYAMFVTMSLESAMRLIVTLGMMMTLATKKKKKTKKKTKKTKKKKTKKAMTMTLMTMMNPKKKKPKNELMAKANLVSRVDTEHIHPN